MNKVMTIEDFIIEDHREIKSLFEKYKHCKNPEEAVKFFNQLSWEVARHSIAEELILYPDIRQWKPNGELTFNESIEEHRKVKNLLYELNSMDYKTSEFDIKFRETMMDLLYHIEKEESIILQELVIRVPMDQRVKMGQKFNNRKFIAPTRPHPWSSDKYPFLETIQGVLLAPIDKFLDMFKSWPEEKDVPKTGETFPTEKSKITETTKTTIRETKPTGL